MKAIRPLSAAVLGLWLAVGTVVPAMAWQLTPEATATERGLAAYSASRLRRAINQTAFHGVAVVGNAVHEDITRQALQCQDEQATPGCEYDIRYQVAGVRWNDDPAFMFSHGHGNQLGCVSGQSVRMVTQPACWARVFLAGERSAQRGVRHTGANSNLLVRSHFGDLQFLHAMAVADGVPPEQTRREVLAWMEFTWRTATGDADFSLQHLVVRLPIDGFAQRFSANQQWRIQDLFTLGDPSARRDDRLQRIALGSLLHVVQDSFAAGHVARAASVPDAVCDGRADWPAPGQIVEFHSYPHQDSRKHAQADEPGALLSHKVGSSPNVIDVTRTLANLWRERAPWAHVQPYLACIFALAPQARPSSPGSGFEVKPPDAIHWGG